MENLTWSVTDTIYDGLPLYLRKPNIDRISQYQISHPRLLNICQEFDKVKTNGLPHSDYNKSLEVFDGEVCSLFDFKSEGFVFLIETYGGSRNYWFYLKSTFDYEAKLTALTTAYAEYKLEYSIRNDENWGFIKEYPYNLFELE